VKNKDIVLEIHENILKYKNTIDILYLSAEYYDELNFEAIEYIFHSYFKNNYTYHNNSLKTLNNTAFLNFIYFLDNNKHLFKSILEDKIISKLDIDSLFKLHSLFIYYIQNNINIDSLNINEAINIIYCRINTLLNQEVLFNSLDNLFLFCFYHNLNMGKYKKFLITQNNINTSNTIVNFIKPGCKPNLNLNINFLVDIIVPVEKHMDIFFEYLFFDNNHIYGNNKSNNKDLNNKLFIYESLQEEIGYKKYIQYILQSNVNKYSLVDSACPFSFDININNNKNIEFSKTKETLNNILLCEELSLEEKLLFLNSLDFNSEVNQHFIFIWLISNINDFSIIEHLHVLKFKVNSFILNFAQDSYEKYDIFKENKEYFDTIFKKKILKLVKQDTSYSMKNINNYLFKHNQKDIFKMFLFFNSVLKNSEIVRIIENEKYKNIRDFIFKKDKAEEEIDVSRRISNYITLEKIVQIDKIKNILISISIKNKDYLFFKKLVPYELFNKNNNIINKKAVKFISDNIDIFYNIHFEYFINSFFYMINNKFINNETFEFYLIETLNENQYGSNSALFLFLRNFIQSDYFNKNLLLNEKVRWDAKIFILLYFFKHSKYKNKLGLNDDDINNEILYLLNKNKGKVLFNINLISKLVVKIGNYNTKEKLKYILINYIDKYNDIEFVKKILNIAEIFNNIDIEDKYKDEFFFLTHGGKNNSIENTFKL
jgi:hypothetical protein